ncbi:MAG: amino acid ABC transporter permease [Desulfovibrionaceae bacterium]|jgi:general L-amino acid transport system permease protein|nr:amino acid ABC transporter permease [Desulfovibrionaceae bacterium]
MPHVPDALAPLACPAAPCSDTPCARPAEAFVPSPALPPPPSAVGPLGWLRANLFDGWFNSLLTLLCMAFLAAVVPPLVSWALLDACFTGDASMCAQSSGACWTFIVHKFRVLMVGTYPPAEAWRPALAGVLLATMVGCTAWRRLRAAALAVLWLLLPLAALWLVGGGAGLAPVDQSQWGGLMLSVGLALVGILVSIPCGVLLALGRRSRIAAVRALCVGIIEPVRGVPLITILFMASVMFPLFLPPDMQINNLLRVQIGMILFSSAYMAEVVRGGLAAVPKGQTDAAKALGLGYWKMQAFVVLPQALRHVLPSLVGRCIALLKDTSLVIIVGLLDFLGMAKAASQDQQWLGHDAEAYIFCALVYWLLCFGMSRWGRSIERRTAHRAR